MLVQLISILLLIAAPNTELPLQATLRTDTLSGDREEGDRVCPVFASFHFGVRDNVSIDPMSTRRSRLRVIADRYFVYGSADYEDLNVGIIVTMIKNISEGKMHGQHSEIVVNSTDYAGSDTMGDTFRRGSRNS